VIHTAHEHGTSHGNQRAQSNTSLSPDFCRNLRKHRVVKTSTLPIGVDGVVSFLWLADGGG